jgi:hypothetical protein
MHEDLAWVNLCPGQLELAAVVQPKKKLLDEEAIRRYGARVVAA